MAGGQSGLMTTDDFRPTYEASMDAVYVYTSSPLAKLFIRGVLFVRVLCEVCVCVFLLETKTTTI